MADKPVAKNGDTVSNTENMMTEELVEEWAEATGAAFNDSLTGLAAERVSAAADRFIELYEQSKSLTFNPEFSPVDYFDEHPAAALAMMLDSPEALAELDDDQEEALEGILEYAQAWVQWEEDNQPELAEDDEDELPTW